MTTAYRKGGWEMLSLAGSHFPALALHYERRTTHSWWTAYCLCPRGNAWMGTSLPHFIVPVRAGQCYKPWGCEAPYHRCRRDQGFGVWVCPPWRPGFTTTEKTPEPSWALISWVRIYEMKMNWCVSIPHRNGQHTDKRSSGSFWGPRNAW